MCPAPLPSTWRPSMVAGRWSICCWRPHPTLDRWTRTKLVLKALRVRILGEILFQFGWNPRHYASRWSQPLDLRLAVGLKPCSPSMNSSKFTFKRIREMRKCQPDESVDKRKKLLASDSGISICGSIDSLKISDKNNICVWLLCRNKSWRGSKSWNVI